MLKILINGQPVDLEGVKFNIQLNSPFPFTPEDNLQEGSFAFGVIFPASPTNKRIFGFPYRLEMHPEPARDFDGLLFFDGRLIFKIVVSLVDGPDHYIKGNIKVDLGYYTNQIGDKTLRELEYDGTVTIGETTDDLLDHANAVVGQTYPAAAYTFPPVYHPRFYGEENKMNPSWFGYMNAYIHGSGFFKNSINSDGTLNNYYNLVPCPYLFKVLRHCFTEFGYKVNGTSPVLNDQELASAIIYNNYALDLITDRYKSKVAAAVDQAIPDWTQLQFENILINTDAPYWLPTWSYVILVPGNVHIEAEIIVEIPYNEDECDLDISFRLDGVSVGSDSFVINTADPTTVKLSLDATIVPADIGKNIKAYAMVTFGGIAVSSYIKIGSWWSAQNIPYSQLNLYSNEINLANHVPDIKISAFLIACLKAFGIIPSIDYLTREVDLLFLKDILASPEEDDYSDLTAKSSKITGFRETKSYKLNFAWSSQDEYTKDNFQPYDVPRLIGTFNTLADLPAVSIEGFMAAIRNLNAVYRFEAGSWVHFTDLHYPYLVGDGVTPVTIDMSPLMMYADYTNPAMPKVYPKVLQEGSSVHLGVKEFGFHVMFYRGLQADAAGHTYPFASSTKFSPTGTVIGNYEMILSGANGIFASFLEEYYNFVMNRTRPVEFEKYFSAAEIQHIDFFRKKRVFQHVFLQKEISIPISMDSIGISNMKLQKI